MGLVAAILLDDCNLLLDTGYPLFFLCVAFPDLYEELSLANCSRSF
jgi:hypothetical protein